MSLAIRSAIFATLTMGVSVAETLAIDFRVETEVFLADRKEPEVEMVAFFSSDLIYDFRTKGSADPIIIDPPRSVAHLLFDKSKEKVSVSFDQIVRWVAHYKSSESKSDLFQFASDPKFERKHDPIAKSLLLKSPVMTYTVRTTQANNNVVARQYRELADWSARLNAIQPGGLPPFARLELNRDLAESNLLPESIERTVTAKSQQGFSRTDKVRTLHHFNWLLSQDDKKRIEDANDNLSKYKSISPDEYLGRLNARVKK